MRMNKYLASTLLTGLLVTAAIISPAQGQEQSLQPQGAWALTKVDRSAQGGNSYCTLSRKYDQDIVLSLGRNQTEEYSLAIDFQKQTFEKDKSLKINLQPGPGQIRAYDMMPTSDKALVIRLGWDEGFFKTLNESQQMKVKIADKSYAFAMPEIAKGQSELRDCMEGLKAAAKGGAPAEQTKDVLAAEAGGSKAFDAGKADEKIAVAAAEKSVLQNFADSIKAQEPSVNDEGDLKRKNFGAKKDEKPGAKKAAAKEPVKTAKAGKTEAPPPPVDDTPAPELIKRPAPRPDKKADAKIAAAPVVPAPDLPRLAPAASDGSNKEELASLQKRLDQLVGENAALKQKAAAGAAPSAETQKELAALEAEKKALEDRVKSLEAEIAQSAKPEDVAKAQARAQELEIKNAQLEESLRSAQVRIGETAVNTEAKALRKIADLEVKLTAAKNDNANLAKQLESMRLQSEDGRLGSVAGDWDLEQATKRYNEAEREVQRLSKQLEQERMSCNREKAEIEQMLFDPAVTDKKQIEKLTQLQKELDDAHALIKDNQKQIQAAVDQQIAAKTQEMAAKIQSAEKEKAAMAQQVAALQKSVAGKDAAARAENDGLKAQIAALQAAPKADPAATAKQIEAEVTKAKAAADQKIAAMQQTLAAKDQELAVLKAVPKADPNATAQQVAAEVAKARAPLDAEIAKLKEGMAAKDQQIAAIQAAPRTDPAILKQVAEMQTSMAALRQENETLRRQVADAALNGGARADQVASLQLQVNELKDQISRKDTQNLTYQNQIAALQQAARQAPAADDSAQVAELTRQIYGLQKEIADMRRERSASAAQYAAVQPAAGAAIAAAYRPSAAASAAASETGYDAGSIKSLLQKAGLSVGSVSKTSGGMPGAENFGWTDGGNVKGTASVKMSSGGFDNQVSQYIAQQKSQCGGGDFASMPSPTNSGGVKRTALYETACVNGGSSVSSSILFFEDQGRFIAISNQIDAADMDIAMDSRDKIASFVRGL